VVTDPTPDRETITAQDLYYNALKDAGELIAEMPKGREHAHKMDGDMRLIKNRRYTTGWML